MPKFQVSRSTTIDASPERVFETVADYNTWTTWSPWLCCEPDATVTVTDDSSSVGSVYAWEGELVGAGEIEHVELDPGRKIHDDLRFLKPFKSNATASFELEPDGTGTRITWHMNGSMPWFMFWMIPMMKAFIGMDYERGLRMLKELIETGELLTRTHIRGIEPVGPLTMIGVRKTSSADDIGASMESAFAEAKQAMEAANIPIDGLPMSAYHDFNIKQQIFVYTSGFAVCELPDVIPDGLEVWSTPEVPALAVEHHGRYEHLGNAWSAANQYARYKKHKLLKTADFEIYRNDPEETPVADILTEIYLPVKG